jgi:ferredoxin-NADP reductase
LIDRDASNEAFSLLLSLSRDSARRPQDIGRRVDADILSVALTRLGRMPRLTFVCGSNPFVEAVTNLLLDMGLGQGNIRTERFGS